MNTSDEGIALIAQREGSKRLMYRDSAGLPTIGVGHLLTQDELFSGKLHLFDITVDWHHGLAQSQVDALLRRDLDVAEMGVFEGVRVSIAQHQYDALVSFTFNVGVRAFRDSTLLKRINAADFAAVPEQLRRWVYSAGVVNEGLRVRREREVAQWRGDMAYA